MIKSRLLALLVIVVAGCDGGGSDARPDSQLPCVDGATECRPDGVYTCDGTTFKRTEACANGCESTPVPQCKRSCGDPGVKSICENGAVKQCSGITATQMCSPGVCMTAGNEAVCATAAGSTMCQGRRADGSFYDLLCADSSGISSTHACDFRSGLCVPSQFDCAKLASTPEGKVVCDATSGDFFTSCLAGQPATLSCSATTSCSSDGSLNCYTPPAAGGTCGGPDVCYPGLHCTQTSATARTCTQPAGQLACTPTDVLAVCTDADTGVACVKGTVWWWDNLTAWGGSCASNHINVPIDGICIPGLGDCKQGLACKRSPYDITGICKTPAPNAPPACTLTGQASTGLSCAYDWHSCEDGHYYDVDCRRVNVGGNVITVCECSIDGTVTKSFGGTAACSVTDVAMLDATLKQSCGWNVTTVDVAP
jgi:hypothetical protein